MTDAVTFSVISMTDFADEVEREKASEAYIWIYASDFLKRISLKTITRTATSQAEAIEDIGPEDGTSTVLSAEVPVKGEPISLAEACEIALRVSRQADERWSSFVAEEAKGYALLEDDDHDL